MNPSRRSGRCWDPKATPGVKRGGEGGGDDAGESGDEGGGDDAGESGGEGEGEGDGAGAGETRFETRPGAQASPHPRRG